MMTTTMMMIMMTMTMTTTCPSVDCGAVLTLPEGQVGHVCRSSSAVPRSHDGKSALSCTKQGEHLAHRKVRRQHDKDAFV
eukprot:1593511-Amphidinium_carterae.2